MPKLRAHILRCPLPQAPQGGPNTRVRTRVDADHGMAQPDARQAAAAHEERAHNGVEEPDAVEAEKPLSHEQHAGAAVPETTGVLDRRTASGRADEEAVDGGSGHGTEGSAGD